MSWVTTSMYLRQATAAGLDKTFRGLQNNDTGRALFGAASNVAGKFSGKGLNGILSMMASPDFAQLPQSDLTFVQDGYKYGALAKAYDGARESYKKMLEKDFEQAKKLDMMG